MKQGIFTLDAKTYRAEHGVSQSDLKVLRQSPAHLKYQREHPKEQTSAMILGELEHYLVLEPRLFARSFWTKPDTYGPDKKKWHGGAKECKDWFKEHADRHVISSSDEEMLLGMHASILAHPSAKAALEQGEPEQCLFWEDAETGLQCKCRCDWLSGNAIVDVKGCQDASPTGFAKNVANMGYDIQAAFNLMGARAVSLGKECFIFIAVEWEPPYAVSVFQLGEASLRSGEIKARRLLNTYMECVSKDQWPAYSENVEVIEVPSWAMAQE